MFFSRVIEATYFHQCLFSLMRFDPIALELETILLGRLCTKDILFFCDDVKTLLGVEFVAGGLFFGLGL
jgi:hypothetical protein